MRKIERFTEFYIIGVLIAAIILISPNHSIWANLEQTVNFVIWIGLYFIQVKWLVPKYLKTNRIKSYLLFTFLSLIVSILILIPVELTYLADMYYRRYYVAAPKTYYLQNFELNYFNETIIGLLIAFTGSIIYSMIRHIKSIDSKFFKKYLPIGFSISIVVLFTGLLILIIKDINPKRPEFQFQTINHNSNIKIAEFENDSLTFDDLLHYSDSSTHAKCILFWTPSCSFQTYMVEQMNKIKYEFNSKKVDFIYVCGDYKDSKERWKDIIITNDIEGIHYFLDRKDFHRLFIDELGIIEGLVYTHVILIDSKKRIYDKNAPIPNKKDELISELKEII